jgi:hypothetical protein
LVLALHHPHLRTIVSKAAVAAADGTVAVLEVKLAVAAVADLAT